MKKLLLGVLLVLGASFTGTVEGYIKRVAKCIANCEEQGNYLETCETSCAQNPNSY